MKLKKFIKLEISLRRNGHLTEYGRGELAMLRKIQKIKRKKWASIDGRTTFPMEDVWEEVKQPVTWQEAFQAWIDGCDIRCEGGGRVSKLKNGSLLLDNLECPPGKWMMKNGTWYIED